MTDAINSAITIQTKICIRFTAQKQRTPLRLAGFMLCIDRSASNSIPALAMCWYDIDRYGITLTRIVVSWRGIVGSRGATSLDIRQGANRGADCFVRKMNQGNGLGKKRRDSIT